MEWISVEDRLPEVAQYILVYLDFKIQSVMLFNNLDEFVSPHHQNGMSSWSKDVTHWMPLPEPPK